MQLSKPQLLAVAYATQANNQTFRSGKTDFRKGFLLGDGTGVGKTLTLVGIALEALENGYVDRVLWVVPNKELIQAAMQEVRRLDENVNLRTINPTMTDLDVKKGIFFCSYHFASSYKNQRQLNKWLGENFCGMVK